MIDPAELKLRHILATAAIMMSIGGTINYFGSIVVTQGELDRSIGELSLQITALKLATYERSLCVNSADLESDISIRMLKLKICQDEFLRKDALRNHKTAEALTK